MTRNGRCKDGFMPGLCPFGGCPNEDKTRYGRQDRVRIVEPPRCNVCRRKVSEVDEERHCADCAERLETQRECAGKGNLYEGIVTL